MVSVVFCGDWCDRDGRFRAIRENLDESLQEREEREMPEAHAMSLSMAPPGEANAARDSQVLPRKAPPPPPPTARPGPPGEAPSSSARLAAVTRLPVLFPPVGHAWNRSALDARAQRPPRSRRRPRVWFAMPGSFAYFPPNGTGYERLRRRRFTRAAVIPDSNTDTEESRGDAASEISTAPSRYKADL